MNPYEHIDYVVVSGSQEGKTFVRITSNEVLNFSV